jgi:16S rRNA processing protein RimM
MAPAFDDLDDFEGLKTERLFLKPVTQTAGLRAKATGATALYREATIREFQTHQRYLILYFEEAPEINAAEPFRSHEVYVYEEELWDLPEGKYYAFQLAGLSLFDTVSGQTVGTVRELKSGVQDYLVIQADGGDFLVPYVPEIVTRVDLEKREIQAALPDGIREI